MSASSSPMPPTRKPREKIIPNTDERCWFQCRQTNAGRLGGKDPRCSIFCYYSNKIPTSIYPPPELLPNPKASQDPRSSDSKGRPINQTSVQPISDDPKDRRAMLIERYTIPALRGKFFYYAIGTPAMARHVSTMKRVHSVEHKWISEKLKEEDQTKKLLNRSDMNRGLMVMAFNHRDYEQTLNISHSIASTFASIHLHFERLYGPAFKILAKLPASVSALASSEPTSATSTQFTLLKRLFDKPILSDSMALAGRSAENMAEILRRLTARLKSKVSDHDGKNKPSPGPGMPPTVPPPAS